MSHYFSHFCLNEACNKVILPVDKDIVYYDKVIGR